MEQNLASGPNGSPGQCGADWEIFRRVWRRVMPEDSPDCPIALNPPPAPEVPRPFPDLPPSPAAPDLPPQPWAAPSADLAPVHVTVGRNGVLQEYILHELTDFRLYTALARRSGGSAAKTLTAIAADEHRHAKRLSAAYFLLSGLHFWPLDRVAAPAIPSYRGLLRERYWGEQAGKTAYREAAETAPDPCLREVYLDLAAEEGDHARLIQSLLEHLP